MSTSRSVVPARTMTPVAAKSSSAYVSDSRAEPAISPEATPRMSSVVSAVITRAAPVATSTAKVPENAA